MVHQWTLSTDGGTCHQCPGHAAVAILPMNYAFLTFTRDFQIRPTVPDQGWSEEEMRSRWAAMAAHWESPALSLPTRTYTQVEAVLVRGLESCAWLTWGSTSYCCVTRDGPLGGFQAVLVMS